MITQRLLLIVVILIVPQMLLSQTASSNDLIALKSIRYSEMNLPNISSGNDLALKYDHILNRFTDTLGVKSLKINATQNQGVRPQWMRASIVPASLILAGTITLLPKSNCFLSKYAIHDKIIDLFSGAKSPIDNYLQFAPLAAVFGLKAAGVKSRSDFLNQVVISAKAELLMTVIVRGMKPWISSDRPSGGLNSMPSGHTAQAFVSATILDMEYRDTSPWISVAGYVVATTTGMYRMINNQHWISDVLIGAGIGIFSTKVVYFTHKYHWGKKNSNMVILPAIYKNGGGVSFAMIL
jgi:membrane-associated phospholipid phosphatase